MGGKIFIVLFFLVWISHFKEKRAKWLSLASTGSVGAGRRTRTHFSVYSLLPRMCQKLQRKLFSLLLPFGSHPCTLLWLLHLLLWPGHPGQSGSVSAQRPSIITGQRCRSPPALHVRKGGKKGPEFSPASHRSAADAQVSESSEPLASAEVPSRRCFHSPRDPGDSCAAGSFSVKREAKGAISSHFEVDQVISNRGEKG